LGNVWVVGNLEQKGKRQGQGMKNERDMKFITAWRSVLGESTKPYEMHSLHASSGMLYYFRLQLLLF
jgi:hypothetical protein